MKTFAAAVLMLAVIIGPMKAEAPVLSQSKVFAFADGSVRKFPNGGEAHDLVLGTLKSGEAVRVHESMQPEGAAPNPPHAIDHSEFIVVLSGMLEFSHDGKVEIAGAGDVIYVAQGTMHQVRNAGKETVRYAIVSIGGDIKQ